MRGTITKRVRRSGKVSWGYSIDTGRDAESKRTRPQRMGFARRADAEAALAQILAELQTDGFIRPTPKTLAEHMTEWLKQREDLERCNLKTLERYREDLNRYVLPRIGHVKLQSINPLHLEQLYAALRATGGRKGSQLAPKTVRNIAGILHAALGAAVRWKLIPRNPADSCETIPVPHNERRALGGDETRLLLDALKGHWLYALVYLGFATGMRRGEMLALTWPDVNFLEKRLNVSKSLLQTKERLSIKPPKNGKPRIVELWDSSVEVLMFHREQQADMRRQFGCSYRLDLDLVFASPDGDFLKPDSITAKVCLMTKKAGLKGVSLHTLRHSHGSQLLSAGIPLPTVSKRLGHSNTQITASVYSHALPEDEQRAAKAWDDKLAAKPKS